MAAITNVKSDLRFHRSSQPLCIADAPLVEGDGFDQCIEFLPGSNSKLLARSACNARDERDTPDRELHIDDRAGLLVDSHDAGREHVEYTNFCRLPDGK